MQLKKNKSSKILLVVALLLLVVSAVWLVNDYQTRSEAQKKFESLAEMAKETVEITTNPAQETTALAETTDLAETTAAPAETQYVSPIDFDALRAINPDVVAWVTIPGTKIDYPVVHTDNNDKYLDTDFEGNKSVAGTVYLDYESKPDFSGRHNILYGHNMKNGSMFKDIVKFKEESYFNEHRDAYIYTPERTIHLRTMAALYGDAAPLKRKTNFASDEVFASYVMEMTNDCSFKDLPDSIGALYSFVTCSYEFDNARTILYAYEVRD